MGEAPFLHSVTPVSVNLPGWRGRLFGRGVRPAFAALAQAWHTAGMRPRTIALLLSLALLGLLAWIAIKVDLFGPAPGPPPMPPTPKPEWPLLV